MTTIIIPSLTALISYFFDSFTWLFIELRPVLCYFSIVSFSTHVTGSKRLPWLVLFYEGTILRVTSFHCLEQISDTCRLSVYIFPLG